LMCTTTIDPYTWDSHSFRLIVSTSFSPIPTHTLFPITYQILKNNNRFP
jgi:hypothetical protein